MLNLFDKGKKVNLSVIEWILFIVGMILVLYSWLYDYAVLIIGGGFTKDFFTLTNNAKFYAILTGYVPQDYNWFVFWAGIALVAIGIETFYNRTKNSRY